MGELQAYEQSRILELAAPESLLPYFECFLAKTGCALMAASRRTFRLHRHLCPSSRVPLNPSSVNPSRGNAPGQIVDFETKYSLDGRVFDISFCIDGEKLHSVRYEIALILRATTSSLSASEMIGRFLDPQCRQSGHFR